jgi:hypothetical protein
MKWLMTLAASLVVATIAAPCFAADPRYPDWPCVQAKVPEVSLAAVWAGPDLDDVAGKWKDDAKISALVSRLAARRTPLEEAEKAVTAFLSDAGAGKTEAGKLLFSGLFETLNAQRASVMNGLERITRKQRAAAEKIRADTLALQAQQGAATPDPAKVEEFGNQLVWATRIFDDRRRVVTFVCEVPVAIDQRLFALGRVIQQEME